MIPFSCSDAEDLSISSASVRVLGAFWPKTANDAHQASPSSASLAGERRNGLPRINHIPLLVNGSLKCSDFDLNSHVLPRNKAKKRPMRKHRPSSYPSFLVAILFLAQKREAFQKLQIRSCEYLGVVP